MADDRHCNTCGQNKAADAFYSWYPTQCKACNRIKRRVSEQRGRERRRVAEREADRRYRQRHPEKYRAAIDRWYAQDPRRGMAHAEMSRALRAGILVRPASCSRCRSRARRKAHHHDYDKPLDVEWLCKPCHAKADREKRMARAS